MYINYDNSSTYYNNSYSNTYTNETTRSTHATVSTTKEYQCAYCDSRIQIRPDENTSLTCPMCGGELTRASETPTTSYVQDEFEPTYTGYDRTSQTWSEPRSTKNLVATVIRIALKAVCSFILISLVFVTLGAIIFMVSDTDESSPPVNYNGYDDIQAVIYVEPLERKVAYSDEYESYYDPITDCYFYLNEDVEPEIWQYWFESISSNYGDYGWMEYDFDEDQWYIETDESNWVKLPAKYQNDPNLWHFSENQ